MWFDPLYLFPEWFIAIVSLVAAMFCIYNWLRYREYAAVGYIIPLIYFAIIYLLFPAYNADDPTRREWVRIGLFLIFIDIIIWRIVFVFRQRRKHKNAIRP